MIVACGVHLRDAGYPAGRVVQIQCRWSRFNYQPMRPDAVSESTVFRTRGHRFVHIVPPTVPLEMPPFASTLPPRCIGAGSIPARASRVAQTDSEDGSKIRSHVNFHLRWREGGVNVHRHRAAAGSPTLIFFRPPARISRIAYDPPPVPRSGANDWLVTDGRSGIVIFMKPCFAS